jgi:putative transposase
MPRTARASVGGICYHVLNRGNGQAAVFDQPADYAAFVELIHAACNRDPMRVLAYCLMPNHFHLVLWPHADGDLSRWMQWLLTAHVRRYHSHHGTSGHVWQGRFKAFPIEQDGHLLTVLRYVERNPLRARLVRRAENWQWSSLPQRTATTRSAWLAAGPVDLPRNWAERVNRPETDAELDAVRRSIMRGAPFGKENWSRRVATRLGLEASLRPRGRPRKRAKK